VVEQRQAEMNEAQAKELVSKKVHALIASLGKSADKVGSAFGKAIKRSASEPLAALKQKLALARKTS
jgi:hypothetical protein